VVRLLANSLSLSAPFHSIGSVDRMIFFFFCATNLTVTHESADSSDVYGRNEPSDGGQRGRTGVSAPAAGYANATRNNEN
jgi:hypothetical protein